MYDALSDALKKAEADASVRVILFQGEGDSFTAGNDLADFASQARGESAVDSPAHRFIETISKASKPLVAAVQGNAVGVGTTMLLHCDLVYLATTAKLITPFVNLALVPEASSSYLIRKRIGWSRAYQMFTLGEPIPAKTCVEWGLAHVCVPRAKLRETALALAKKLADKPLGSLCATKRLMRETEAVKAAAERERGVFEERLLSKEAGEAFKAFAEKRPPDFRKVG